MNCEQTRTWLLEADDPRPERCPALIGQHLAGCATCRAVATELGQLEQAYRALPAPPEAEPARLAFLKKLPATATPPRRLFLPRWGLAAAVLLSLGAALWFLAPAPEVQAAPTLVERLVDWNVELADTPPAERGPVFAAKSATFQKEITTAAPSDRELAGLLLDNGAWLAKNDDPVATAERFSAVADQLVERMQSASELRDIRLANRYDRLQAQVARRGIADNLKKAVDSGTLDFDNHRRLERVVLRDQDRMKKLVDLLEKNPDISRRELRKALDITPKNPKGTGKNKGS